jgi:hypothetical protein
MQLVRLVARRREDVRVLLKLVKADIADAHLWDHLRGTFGHHGTVLAPQVGQLLGRKHAGGLNRGGAAKQPVDGNGVVEQCVDGARIVAAGC